MKYIINFFNPHHTGKHNDLPEHVTEILHIPWLLFRMSFISGTLLWFLYLMLEATPLLIIGFYYVRLAFFINAIMLLMFGIFACFHLRYFWLVLQKTSVILLNIPIVWLYMYIMGLW